MRTSQIRDPVPPSAREESAVGAEDDLTVPKLHNALDRQRRDPRALGDVPKLNRPVGLSSAWTIASVDPAGLNAMAPTTTSSAIVPTNSPVAASQSLARPLTPTVVKMVPSALMLMSQPPGTWNGLRRNDPVRRPRWLPLDRVAAASVSPSGEKASALAHHGVQLRRLDRGQDHRIPEADALLLETDRDQPSVGAEDPGVPRERDVGNRAA